MAETTIPKKVYVTIQYRGDANNESGLLGFASPYTKDSAFRKRKETQDKWAYGYGVNVAIDDDDCCSVTGEGTRGGYGGSQKWDATMLFIANCHPRILDNEPVEGFEIAKSVRRYGWNGGGNVKWRITDPRGFDLEFSSENFASIIDCSTIANGVIQGKCVWGRNGKDNILLPESSQPFIDAVKQTTKVNSKVSLKDVQVGDMVEIMSTKVVKEDQSCQYLGKYFFLETTEGSTDDSGRSYRYRYGNGVHSFTQQKESYLFKAGEKYFVLASPKITSITTKIDTPLDKVAVAKELTEKLSRSFTIRDIDNLILVSATKLAPTDIVTELVPLSEVIGESWPKVDNYQVDPIVCKIDGKFWMASGSYYHDDKGPKVSEIDISGLSQNKITKRTTATYNRYYGRDQHDPVMRTVRPSEVEKFRLVVKANGISANVYRI